MSNKKDAKKLLGKYADSQLQIARLRAESQAAAEMREKSAAAAAPAAPPAKEPTPQELAEKQHEDIKARGREIKAVNPLAWAGYVMANISHYDGRDAWKQ